MKNPILRILISAALLALISALVVVLIGLKSEWKTSIQFSDGFFWAGALMIFIGFVSYQGYRQPIDGPEVYLDPAERSKIWAGRHFSRQEPHDHIRAFRLAAVHLVPPGRETVLARNESGLCLAKDLTGDSQNLC